MLLTILMPFFLDYSYLSIFLSVLCGLLAFYTKPYFILGIPVIASYLYLFISKKKFWWFSCYFLISLILSIMVMDRCFPSYFNDCFFLHYNNVGHNTMMIVFKTPAL